MSWICRAQPEMPVRLQMKSTMSELKKIDPKTRQIYTEILSEEASHNVSKYEDWSRVKIQTINTRELAKHLRQSKKSFTDPDFPHHNSMLSSGFFTGQIKWVRVIDLVENAVYSKEQTRTTLQSIKINRPAFEKALVLIARTSPTLYKEILSKTLNREGIYQFKLFKDGYIQNVVVDDYIPTHQGMPIFVAPVRQNQVYPMLLEKALAKVCGSYENIPEEAEEILEMIFCGPVTIKSITDLRQQNLLGQSLRSSLDRKQLTVLMSRKDPKIRNYGLNDNQVYMVINHYEIEWGGQQLKQLQQSRTSFLNMSNIFRKSTIEDKKSLCYSRTVNENSLERSHIMQSSLYSKESKQNKESKENSTQIEHIYQCISESKLSAWNGRFSLNDQVWSKIDPRQKSQLYKSIKDNRSFLINQTDVARLYEEVLVFQTNETNNKEWIHNESHNNLPSFTRFEVSKPDSILIRITTPSKIKQTVILARETAARQYEFVTSNFSSSSDRLELSGQVYPGKYVIVAFHQWLFNKRGSYYVFLSSHNHITLAIGGTTDHEFLNKAIASFERLRPHNAKEDKEECTIRLQLQTLGLAYIVLKPYNSKSKALTLKIDKNYLKKDNWEMMEPYNGLSQVIVSETFDRSETIIVMTRANIDSNKRYYFPFAAFSVKK